MTVESELAAVANGPTDSTEPWHEKARDVLSVAELAELNPRSDAQGWRQLVAHLVVMLGSAALWTMGLRTGAWGLALPALVVYGFSLAAMFATLHECVHRTAFATPKLNDAVAWLAGVLSLYNSTFYRRYHKWHHRYTQIPGKDPELDDPAPTTWTQYLWQLSGLPWWWGKVQGHWQSLLGDVTNRPYLNTETIRAEVQRSTAAQLVVYAVAIVLSVWLRYPGFVLYWLLPLAVGQPILRFILLAEHTGCPQTANPLENTRTTLTLAPIRLLMWNMPYHAEHHLYASIPFHALPQAHRKLAERLTQVAPGYVAVNRQITATFGTQP
ncbi:fatty acid desaturase (plasmid) [Leptolyngbya sp. BL0902]|uniref:fatty acid desaturase family protein n=1 Tax=Leptolyngbya sp. BL0902 TaxID=1115757 RepID=UPI0018E76159|nr:fatty acid desaturase family protein [Leptolyngbya sp. BL0902]QQE67621.1 fatty acid desaturase [Leptolyngbya sp. BL0902]